MSPWDRLLQQPQHRSHFVQLYNTERASLTRNVSRFMGEGLRRGDSVLVIATQENWKSFCRELDAPHIELPSCLQNGQLLFLDALETLSSFMVAGQPEWDRFEGCVRGALRQLRPPVEGAGFRAYGEMVAVLWRARQFSAAVRLEQFWNKLLTQLSFSLYCSYAIDVFGKDFHPDALDALLSTHTHLVPTVSDGKLEPAFDRAMSEVLGPEANNLKPLIRANHRPSWAVMPDAESMILWIRKNLPKHADEIIERARIEYLCAVGDPRPADSSGAADSVCGDGPAVQA